MDSARRRPHVVYNQFRSCLLLCCVVFCELTGRFSSAKAAEEIDTGMSGQAPSDGMASQLGGGVSLVNLKPIREVVDIEVPSPIGKYPLRAARNLVCYRTADASEQNWVYDPDIGDWILKTQYFATTGHRWYFSYVYLATRVNSTTFWVRYPDGTSRLFKKSGTYSYTDGIGDRLACDATNFPSTLFFPDGGRVNFRLHFTENGTKCYGGYQLIDPEGVVTSITLSPTARVYPLEVCDAAGRKLTYTLVNNRITRISASTGDKVDFVYPNNSTRIITQAIYLDGTTASYGIVQASNYIQVASGFRDTRSTSPMQEVDFHWEIDPLPIEEGWLRNPIYDYPGYPAFLREERDPGSQTVVAKYPWYIGEAQRGDGTSYAVSYEYSNGIPYVKVLTDGNGNQVTYTYDSRRFRNSQKDARNYTTTFVNDTNNGLPTSMRNPDDTSRSAAYQWATDGTLRLASATSENGARTAIERFSTGGVRSITYPDGSVETWGDLNAFKQPTTHTLRNGATEWFDYDSGGRLVRHWHPSFTGKSAFTSYTYYPAGDPWADRIATTTDPRGNTTSFEYDLRFENGVQGTVRCPGKGLITKQINPDNTFRTFVYDPRGRKLSETDELGATTTFEYDAYGRVINRTDALRRSTRFEYQHEGFSSNPLAHRENKPRFIIHPSGKKDAFTYDANFQTTCETKGFGTTEAANTTYAYDAVGNQTSVTDADGRVTTFAYDNRNRKTHKYAALGRTTQWQYDAVGNVTRVTNPDGTFTRKEYDAMSRVIHAYDERNQHTGTTYHASGQVHVITDPRGSTYTHAYDAADRMTSRTYPDATTESWIYDAAGNKVAETTRTGQVLRFYYDNRNREYWREWDNSAAPFVGTQYDAASRVTNKYNWHGWLTYALDAAGQVTSETQKIYGPTSLEDGRTETVTFAYDADGNRTSFGSNAIGLDFLYTARNQLSTVRYMGMDWVRYEYTPSGLRRFRVNFNGTMDDINYDDAGRLNYLNTIYTNTANSVLKQVFGYDVRDRRTWVVRDDQYGDTWRYQEDSQLIEQRTNVWRPDQNFWNPASFTDGFAYDPAGNRTSWNENGAVTTYTADSCNRYTAITGLSIQHDGRGNVTQLGNWSFGLDPENRMVRATGPGHDYRFHYDAQGRLSKIVDWVVPGGAFEYRFYDGSQQFWRVKGDGTWLDLTVLGATPDEVVSRYVPGSDWWSNWQFYHQDPLNSVVAVTSHTGAIRERYKYDAFGEAAIYDASWNPRSTSAIGNRWQFTGQEYFAEIGIHNYKARWYCNRIGRFLQNDPVRFDGGDLNLYRYTSNNPVNLVDHTGLIEAMLGFDADAVAALGDFGLELEIGGGFYLDTTNPLNSGFYISSTDYYGTGGLEGGSSSGFNFGLGVFAAAGDDLLGWGRSLDISSPGVYGGNLLLHDDLSFAGVAVSAGIGSPTGGLSVSRAYTTVISPQSVVTHVMDAANTGNRMAEIREAQQAGVVFERDPSGADQQPLARFLSGLENYGTWIRSLMSDR